MRIERSRRKEKESESENKLYTFVNILGVIEHEFVGKENGCSMAWKNEK